MYVHIYMYMYMRVCTCLLTVGAYMDVWRACANVYLYVGMQAWHLY